MPNAPLFAPTPLVRTESRQNYTNNITTDPGAEANQLISSGPLSLAVVTAEPFIYLQGFSKAEYADQAPAILRGSLVLRCSKPCKIRAISLSFKGLARTEWPEGLPPRKTDNHEESEVLAHLWPFFNAAFPTAELSSGASIVRLDQMDRMARLEEGSDDDDDDGHASLSVRTVSRGLARLGRAVSPAPRARSRSGSPNPATLRSRSVSMVSTESHAGSTSVHPGSLLNPNWNNGNGNGNGTGSGNVNGNGNGNGGGSGNSSGSGSGNSSVNSNVNGNGNANNATNTAPLTPSDSMSSLSEEGPPQETRQRGFRIFYPGEYVYNFELPIPQSLPESIECAYGSVRYWLEASVERPGAFKSNLSGKRELRIIRDAAPNNLEAVEPIMVSRDWEDQLHYDIVVGGKAFPIGQHMPVAFKLTPQGKVRWHRLRIYVTENTEYFANARRVHRIEPTRKYLLKEQVPQGSAENDLLQQFMNHNTAVSVEGHELGGSAELEYMVHIPETFPHTVQHRRFHPNTTYTNIKVHHWIKVVLRLSKPDPDGSSKRKFFEISIDSPISLLDPLCTMQNTTLPPYVNNRMVPADDQPSPDPVRPIHLLRRPSTGPPAFEDAIKSSLVREPSAAPPGYDDVLVEKQHEMAQMRELIGAGHVIDRTDQDDDLDLDMGRGRSMARAETLMSVRAMSRDHSPASEYGTEQPTVDPSIATTIRRNESVDLTQRQNPESSLRRRPHESARPVRTRMQSATSIDDVDTDNESVQGGQGEGVQGQKKKEEQEQKKKEEQGEENDPEKGGREDQDEEGEDQDEEGEDKDGADNGPGPEDDDIYTRGRSRDPQPDTQAQQTLNQHQTLNQPQTPIISLEIAARAMSAPPPLASKLHDDEDDEDLDQALETLLAMPMRPRRAALAPDHKRRSLYEILNQPAPDEAMDCLQDLLGPLRPDTHPLLGNESRESLLTDSLAGL